MGKLLDWFKGKSPTPKKMSETRFVTIPMEEYELLQVAAWNKGERSEAQKQLKIINAWKINNGL